MRDDMRLRLLIEIVQRFTAELLVLAQIKIGSVRDSFQFLHPERELKFNVVRSFRIMSALLGRNRMNVQLVGRQADIVQKPEPFLEPVLEQFKSLMRETEIF